MRARDLAQSIQPVQPDEPLATALLHMVDSRLPGIVVDSPGSLMVIPASQLLRAVLPQYVQDDPSLARVWDEQSADRVAAALADRHVADLVRAVLAEDAVSTAVVDGDATLVEIATIMAQARVPMVAVVDHGAFVGIITVNHALEHLLG